MARSHLMPFVVALVALGASFLSFGSAGCSDGDPAVAERVTLDARRTTPPARYTDGSLLLDMAAIAKYVDDPSLKARLKETSGIGTSVTRSAIFKILKKRGYLTTKGKSLRPERHERSERPSRGIS